MQPDSLLLSENPEFVTGAIERIRSFTQNLPRPGREISKKEAHAAHADLEQYRSAMDRLLAPPDGGWSASASKALHGLFAAHALTLAMAAELEAVEALNNVQHAAAAAPQPGGWWAALSGLLGRLANWIWSVIQTMITPKGWSIEGGISVPGLANAKLKIDFG